MRFIRVFHGDIETVSNYLPANFKAIGNDPQGNIIVVGEDDHGWTVDDYVIPRLGSGLIVAKEFFPFPHYHVGPNDECGVCGGDFRNDVHIRNES